MEKRNPMAGTGKPRSDSEQSLGELVAMATQDLSKLVRYEIDLAKAELRDDLKRAAVGGTMFGITAFFGFGILVALFFAYVYLLHEVAGLPGGLAAAYGVTAATVLVIGVITFFVGQRTIKRVTGMKRTRESVSEGIGMLRRNDKNDKDGSAVEPGQEKLQLADGQRPDAEPAVGGAAAGEHGGQAGISGQAEITGPQPPR
jgi:hypothetical protein